MKNNIATVLSFLVIVIIINACTSSKNSFYWVNSFKSECSGGAGEMQCLSIHRGTSMNNPSWEYFYANINGFSFEPGFFQKIKVKEEKIDESQVPADASSIKYTLIKVMKKNMDSRYILNDIWIAQDIYGVPIGQKDELPRMEINFAKMQVFGNNSCNEYTGKIEKLTSSEIQFGTIATTRKMCLDMNIADDFDRALNSSITYKLENLKLIFLDKVGNETISFKKGD